MKLANTGLGRQPAEAGRCTVIAELRIGADEFDDSARRLPVQRLPNTICDRSRGAPPRGKGAGVLGARFLSAMAFAVSPIRAVSNRMRSTRLSARCVAVAVAAETSVGQRRPIE